MDIFLSTFKAVAMLLFIGVIGFWMVNRKMVSDTFFSLLSPLALEIALPSLVFVNIIRNFNPATKTDWWILPVWWLLFTAVAFIVAITGMYLISSKEKKREFGLTLFYQNGLFFPLAIITGLFGSNSGLTVDLFFFMIFYASLFFNTSHLFFRKEGSIKWGKIFHPVFIMTVLAITLRITGLSVHIPDFIISGLRMVGNMSVPLLMLILGGNMLVDFRNIGKVYVKEVTKFVLFKNIIMPSLFLLLIYFIRPAYNIAFILILEASVPPVTASPIVTEREGGDRIIVNQYMIGSFILSLFSIPLFIYLFNLLY